MKKNRWEASLLDEKGENQEREGEGVAKRKRSKGKMELKIGKEV